MIEQIRIDDRLIHGQIIAAWINVLKFDTIVVADDKAASNSLSKTLFKMAVPGSIDLKVLLLEQSIQYLNENNNKKIFLIVGSLDSLNYLVNSNLPISSVNIGNLGPANNRKQYFKSIWLNENDMNILNSLKNNNIDMYAQVVPTEKKIDIFKLINK